MSDLNDLSEDDRSQLSRLTEYQRGRVLALRSRGSRTYWRRVLRRYHQRALSAPRPG